MQGLFSLRFGFSGGLVGGDLDHLAAAVVAAGGAGAVGHDRLAAVGARRQAGSDLLAEPLRKAVVGSAMGLSDLRGCHGYFPPLSFSCSSKSARARKRGSTDGSGT